MGQKMKVLTIKEPWATMILEGKKTIETRTWHTRYRGEILLHASKSPESKISGKIFAIANIVDCDIMTKGHEEKACCKMYAGAKSWLLEDVMPIELIEAKGSLGLWDLDGIEIVKKELEKENV